MELVLFLCVTPSPRDVSSSRAGPYYDSVPNTEWARGLYLRYDKRAREYFVREAVESKEVQRGGMFEMDVVRI